MRSSGDRDRGGDVVPETPELLVAAVPEPRPELLARVLAGLRDLPETSPRPTPTVAPAVSTPRDADAVLPRRRT